MAIFILVIAFLIWFFGGLGLLRTLRAYGTQSYHGRTTRLRIWLIANPFPLGVAIIVGLFVAVVVGVGIWYVSRTNSMQTGSADIPTQVGADPEKATQPANTQICDSGNADLFTAVAADLGVKGLGKAGAVDGIPYTSCGFALNVRAAYKQLYPDGTSGDVFATSPEASNLGSIRMWCQLQGGNIIHCTGGNNAQVYIY